MAEHNVDGINPMPETPSGSGLEAGLPKRIEHLSDAVPPAHPEFPDVDKGIEKSPLNPRQHDVVAGWHPGEPLPEEPKLVLPSNETPASVEPTPPVSPVATPIVPSAEAPVHDETADVHPPILNHGGVATPSTEPMPPARVVIPESRTGANEQAQRELEKAYSETYNEASDIYGQKAVEKAMAEVNPGGSRISKAQAEEIAPAGKEHIDAMAEHLNKTEQLQNEAMAAEKAAYTYPASSPARSETHANADYLTELSNEEDKKARDARFRAEGAIDEASQQYHEKFSPEEIEAQNDLEVIRLAVKDLEAAHKDLAAAQARQDEAMERIQRAIENNDVRGQSSGPNPAA